MRLTSRMCARRGCNSFARPGFRFCESWLKDGECKHVHDENCGCKEEE